MVRVLFLGRLQDVAGEGERTVEAAPSVAALIDSFAPDLAQAVRSPRVRVAVNGVLGGPESAVADDDEVAFLPPVSGG